MATKTWNGTDGQFNSALDWSSGTVPVPGDMAVINAGTVTSTQPLQAGLVVALVATSSTVPALVLRDADIAAGATVHGETAASAASLRLTGQVRNAGNITFDGAGGTTVIGVQDDGNGVAGRFENDGGLSLVGQTAYLASQSTAAAGSFVNNGVVSVRGDTTAYVNAPVSGAGQIRVGDGNGLQLSAAVGAGQRIILEPGTGASQLRLTDAGEYAGVISGFGASDVIRLTSGRWDSSSVSSANGTSTLSLTLAGAAVARVAFEGAYTAANLSLSSSYDPSTAQQTTVLSTTVADRTPVIAFTDTTNSVSGIEAAKAYIGPVAGLQWEYLWSSPDAVAMAAQVPNVFLHGGPGGDALLAKSGSNVLDGGGGSNFLVGASGSDGGADTFFVDGRGGVETWSTIVNFHPGDAATIFGFHAGTSTLPWTASDGAPGSMGATIHSELNGAGTGVNGSMTFAGIDLATVQSHFAITTGNVGGSDYLLIQYLRPA